jgi:hypothetical protein
VYHVSLQLSLHKALQVHPASFLHSPPQAFHFLLAVLCHSENDGIRLVGYVEILKDKILGSVEANSCSRCSPCTLRIITEDQNIAIDFKLNKVNSDGPSLKLNAGFSAAELPYCGVSGLALAGLPDNKCRTAQMLSDHLLSYPQLPLSRVAGSKMSCQRCMKIPRRQILRRCHSFM